MIVEGYGIRLRRLQRADIELVRHWRNSSHINRFMVFREEISTEEQLKWFETVDNLQNNYFLIEVDERIIGLINGSKIDWDKGETGSGGIFIWEEQYWKTIVPISASLLLTDTSVLLGLKRTFAKVLKSNQNALSFNEMLGYVPLPNSSKDETVDLVLEIERYIQKRDVLRKSLFKGTQDFKVKIIFENSNDPIDRFYIEKLQRLNSDLATELELIIAS